MAYDYIFDNLYILSLPPQAQQTIDHGRQRTRDNAFYTPNFLANGGIPNVLAPDRQQPGGGACRDHGFIDDQEVPYSLTWTGSFQRQF